MTLNSESLFHFTSSRENIESILKDGFFWPIYCAEVDKEYKDHLHACAFPMVCFCDIPLSQIEEHTNDYGNYAIAMSKEWAKKRGVSPVTYYAGSESLAIKLLRRNENIVSKKDKAFWLSLLKKYRGKTWSLKENGFKTIINYIFYTDEYFNESEFKEISFNITKKLDNEKIDIKSIKNNRKKTFNFSLTQSSENNNNQNKYNSMNKPTLKDSIFKKSNTSNINNFNNSDIIDKKYYQNKLENEKLKDEISHLRKEITELVKDINKQQKLLSESNSQTKITCNNNCIKCLKDENDNYIYHFLHDEKGKCISEEEKPPNTYLDLETNTYELWNTNKNKNRQ